MKDSLGDFMGTPKKKKSVKRKVETAAKPKRAYTRRKVSDDSTEAAPKRKYTRRAKDEGTTVTIAMPKDPKAAFKLGYLTAQFQVGI